jgi:hypothetical protein
MADELCFGMPAPEQGRLARLEDAPGSAETFAAMPDNAPFFTTAPRASCPTPHSATVRTSSPAAG